MRGWVRAGLTVVLVAIAGQVVLDVLRCDARDPSAVQVVALVILGAAVGAVGTVAVGGWENADPPLRPSRDELPADED